MGHTPKFEHTYQYGNREEPQIVTSPRTDGTAGVSEQGRVVNQGLALWHYYIDDIDMKYTLW